MQVTDHSRRRLMLSATRWSVCREYFDPLYNYLVHGFEPGSFWKAVLANDFAGAMQSSHPGNDISALKYVVGWVRDSFPRSSYGDYDTVTLWVDLEPIQRRMILEQHQLIYTEQEEIMMILRSEPAHEPLLY
jgi:hypothetical protein